MFCIVTYVLTYFYLDLNYNTSWEVSGRQGRLSMKVWTREFIVNVWSGQIVTPPQGEFIFKSPFCVDTELCSWTFYLFLPWKKIDCFEHLLTFCDNMLQFSLPMPPSITPCMIRDYCVVDNVLFCIFIANAKILDLCPLCVTRLISELLCGIKPHLCGKMKHNYISNYTQALLGLG